MRGAVAICILVGLLAGCTGGAPEAADVAATQAIDPGVSSSELMPVALQAARAWDPDARLWAVATFEFDWQGDSALAAPYNRTDPFPGDGLAYAWTFSFRAPADVLDVVGQRTWYVVHVDLIGRVIDAYETSRPEEGALGTGPVTSLGVDSERAALAAKMDAAYGRALLEDDRRATMTLLEGGRHGDHDGAVWDLSILVSDGDGRHDEVHVQVDAATGKLL